MEINNIQNTQISDLSLLKDSINTNQINQKNINNHLSESNTYSIDPNITIKRSNLSQNLNQFITSISQNQLDNSNLNIQNNLLTNISSEIKTIQNYNEVEPQTQNNIAQLLSKYNSITSIISTNSNNDSRGYFDGRLGAAPLSVNELVDAVSQQIEIVKQNQSQTLNKLDEIQTKAKNVLSEEISNHQALKPRQNFDFGKNTSDFSATSINSIIGSVAATQANAIPSHAQRLLS